MPATIKIKAYPAKPSEYRAGAFSVIFDLTGKPLPIAPRVLTVKTTAEALSALETYKEEATATGLQLAVCMTLEDGRAPNGFKAATTGHNFYHGINV